MFSVSVDDECRYVVIGSCGELLVANVVYTENIGAFLGRVVVYGEVFCSFW